jgi:hypothetical protein
MSQLQAVVQSSRVWLPGYSKARLRSSGRTAIKRIWVAFTDHFEPGWREPNNLPVVERVERWRKRWPVIAARHLDSAGRPPCYTFFYPEEQYEPRTMDQLASLREDGVGDVEVHLHHDRDTESSFVERMTTFVDRLHKRHGLLHRLGNRTVFGFIHGNWALDNSLPGGRFCGLNNEISLLRDLGCYADFTLPSAPSPSQTRMVNTIYWATDDPLRPKSHDTGIPVTRGGPVAGDLMMIPGPLTVNFREWRTKLVPKLECGELAGNCLPTRHRARLWTRVAPRIGEDLFVKLFGHGAPEKNALPMLEDGGILDRTLDYLKDEAADLGAQIFFVSAWEMWRAIDAVRLAGDPMRILDQVHHDPETVREVHVS